MRRLPIYIAAFVLAFDQLSKLVVVRQIQLDDVLVVIPGVLNFVHSANSGIAFGMLDAAAIPAKSAILIGFSLVILAGIAFLIWRSHDSGLRLRWALGLVAGGAVGNLVDRVRTGSVVDFIDFHIAQHHWHTFNLADSAIVIGAILLVIDVLLSKSADESPSA